MRTLADILEANPQARLRDDLERRGDMPVVTGIVVLGVMGARVRERINDGLSEEKALRGTYAEIVAELLLLLAESDHHVLGSLGIELGDIFKQRFSKEIPK